MHIVQTYLFLARRGNCMFMIYVCIVARLVIKPNSLLEMGFFYSWKFSYNNFPWFWGWIHTQVTSLCPIKCSRRSSSRQFSRAFTPHQIASVWYLSLLVVTHQIFISKGKVNWILVSSVHIQVYIYCGLCTDAVQVSNKVSNFKELIVTHRNSLALLILRRGGLKTINRLDGHVIFKALLFVTW